MGGTIKTSMDRLVEKWVPDFERDFLAGQAGADTKGPTLGTGLIIGDRDPLQGQKLSAGLGNTALFAGLSPLKRGVGSLPVLNGSAIGGTLMFANTEAGFFDSPTIGGLLGLAAVTGVTLFIKFLFDRKTDKTGPSTRVDLRSEGQPSVDSASDDLDLAPFFDEGNMNYTYYGSQPISPYEAADLLAPETVARVLRELDAHLFGSITSNSLADMTNFLDEMFGRSSEVTGSEGAIRVWPSRNENDTATAFQLTDANGRVVVIIAGDHLEPGRPGIQVRHYEFQDKNLKSQYFHGVIADAKASYSQQIENSLLRDLFEKLGATLPGSLPKLAVRRALAEWDRFPDRVKDGIVDQMVFERSGGIGCWGAWASARAIDIVFGRTESHNPVPTSFKKMMRVWDSGEGLGIDNPAFVAGLSKYSLYDIFGPLAWGKSTSSELRWKLISILTKRPAMHEAFSDFKETLLTAWIGTILSEVLPALYNKKIVTTKQPDGPFIKLRVNDRTLYLDVTPIEMMVRRNLFRAEVDSLTRWFFDLLKLRFRVSGTKVAEYVPLDKLPAIAMAEGGMSWTPETIDSLRKRLRQLYGDSIAIDVTDPALQSWNTWNNGQIVLHEIDAANSEAYSRPAHDLGINHLLPTRPFKYAVVARGYDKNVKKQKGPQTGYDVVWFFQDNGVLMTTAIQKWTWNGKKGAPQVVLYHTIP